MHKQERSLEHPCTGCRLAIGVGGTYHFWGATRGLVVPVTFTWRDGRYELGVFRMATRQTLEDDSGSGTRKWLADPYWGASLSRRWTLIESRSWRLFFGFGASYKTESDYLNSTHWNFASQLGVRIGSANDSNVELSVRHWSNASIRLPNRGQDFVTLTYVF